MLKRTGFRPGRGFKPLHLLRYVLLRCVPYATMRRRLADVIASSIDSRTPFPQSGAVRRDYVDAARTLETRGLTSLAPVLSDAQLDSIVAYLRGIPVVAASGAHFSPEHPPVKITRASYSLETVLACPHIVELINSPELLHLVAQYLGCAPTISSIGIHWSFPCDSAGDHDGGAAPPQAVQEFHRDPDDWRFLKLFVYLSDVDAASGPHEYVLTSHRSSGRLRGGAYADGEVLRKHSRDLIKVTGPRGTSFLADTWGLHKGGIPLAKPRLIFQVQYSILPIYKFDYTWKAASLNRPINQYASRLFLA